MIRFQYWRQQLMRAVSQAMGLDMRRVVTQTYYSVLFISLFGLGGCLQVVSPVVLGTKVVSVELEEWEGSWRGPDDVEVSLEVINPNEGVVALSWSEVIDGEETFNRSRAYFRSMSGVLFVSAEMPLDDDGNTGYLWGRVERHGDEVFIVPPSARLFRWLVEEGDLQAESAPELIVLRDVQTTDIDLLLMKWRHLFFDDTNALVFRRAG